MPIIRVLGSFVSLFVSLPIYEALLNNGNINLDIEPSAAAGEEEEEEDLDKVNGRIRYVAPPTPSFIKNVAGYMRFAFGRKQKKE